MTPVPGADDWLSDDEIALVLRLAAQFDWQQPRPASVQFVSEQTGWVPTGPERKGKLAIRSDLSARVSGDHHETDRFSVPHTNWIPRSDADRLPRWLHVRAIAARTVGQPAEQLGWVDGLGEGWLWSLHGGCRLWVTVHELSVWSPAASRAQKFAEQNPEKYASYDMDDELS